MANSVIKNGNIMGVRSVIWPYSMSANGNTSTNLRTLIDNDMPDGYGFGGLSGFATNSIYVQVCNLKYANTSYSLQLANRSASSVSGNMEVYYIAIPK